MRKKLDVKTFIIIASRTGKGKMQIIMDNMDVKKFTAVCVAG
mgnify:CR=1 FL=1